MQPGHTAQAVDRKGSRGGSHSFQLHAQPLLVGAPRHAASSSPLPHAGHKSIRPPAPSFPHLHAVLLHRIFFTRINARVAVRRGSRHAILRRHRGAGATRRLGAGRGVGGMLFACGVVGRGLMHEHRRARTHFPGAWHDPGQAAQAAWGTSPARQPCAGVGLWH